MIKIRGRGWFGDGFYFRQKRSFSFVVDFGFVVFFHYRVSSGESSDSFS